MIGLVDMAEFRDGELWEEVLSEEARMKRRRNVRKSTLGPSPKSRGEFNPNKYRHCTIQGEAHLIV